MIYKHLVLLLLVASLGACSSIDSLVGTNTSTANETQKMGKPKASEQETDSVITEVTPPSAELLLVQSLVSQSDLYQSSKRALSPNTKTKVVKALHEYDNGEFEQSEKSIKKVLATELNLNSAVYVLAGDIALANGKKVDAMAHYRTALKLNNYNAKAANRLAMQLREQGEFARAEKLYTQAINAQPSQAESYRNRAVLYDLYLDEKAKAYQDYKTYSALLKHSLETHENPDKNTVVANAKALSDIQLTSLKTNIKLVKRWLADVGRQVAALAIVEPNNSAGGN